MLPSSEQVSNCFQCFRNKTWYSLRGIIPEWISQGPFKDRGDYRYQLLDLCPSLRLVDGEELWAFWEKMSGCVG